MNRLPALPFLTLLMLAAFIYAAHTYEIGSQIRASTPSLTKQQQLNNIYKELETGTKQYNKEQHPWAKYTVPLFPHQSSQQVFFTPQQVNNSYKESRCG